MLKIFNTLQEYNLYTNNGQDLQSGIIYFVKEDNSIHFFTNNIDGTAKVYNGGDTESLMSDINGIIERNVTEINIPEGVTTIGEGTFKGWYQLQGVTLSDSLTSIGKDAFKNTGIKKVVIPDTVTTIGETAFKECYYITTVDLGNGLISIGKEAFRGCDGTTGTLIIPSTVTTIGQGAFQYCKFTGTLIIPNSVTSIGDDAFNNCDKFTGELNIPSSLTSISNSIFNSCKKITSVNIPDSVTSIGDYAFYNCQALTEAVIGEGIESIGLSAFNNCSNLVSVYVFAETPPTLGGIAFSGASENLMIYVPNDSVAAYKAASGWSTYAEKIYPMIG